MKTDALSRRSRFAGPQPLDGKLYLTPRDIQLFLALDRHGYLPTTYLHELNDGKDLRSLQGRLTQLYNGVCTHPDHKAKFKDGHTCTSTTYIARHHEQFNNFQARYQPAVYHLTLDARILLHKLGKAARPFKRSNSFIHDFFLGCFTASVELAAHRFIFRDEILTHDRSKADKVEFPDIVPDDMFGLEYRGGGFRFFALEIDRATESMTGNLSNSLENKLKTYVQILEAREHTSHFGLPNMSVLFATTNAKRVDALVRYAKEKIPTNLQSKFLFKCFPEFGTSWTVPRETLPAFDVWQSALGEADISKKATS